jgi:sorting nexin-1/2
VLRRYSDFLWLYETLSINNPGVVVPPTPEKSSFGRFDDTFVQQRRLGLEKCIQKIANHPVLCKDPDLKFFLESDNFALDVCDLTALCRPRGAHLIYCVDQATKS